MINKKLIDERKKFTFFEKILIKRLIKMGKKRVRQMTNFSDLHSKERILLETELLSMRDVLEIEIEDDVYLNSRNIKKFSNEELEKTFIEALDEMERIL